MNKVFIPGLALCEQFYHEAVAPILHTHFPGLAYAAALIGSGSEVMGFDDETSTDHHWGPRLMLFLSEEACRRCSEKIHQTLACHLPLEFQGYPTHFTPPNPHDNGVQLLQPIAQGPVNHRVSTYTLRGFFAEYLGFDIDQPLEPADWLTFSEQRLRTITGGAVYHDDIGLNSLRAQFSYYPHDVWLYLLAAAWARIGQEEHLMGRAGMVDDEVGSAVIGARLVRDVMRLCFLMERSYAPYPKWFGTAFKQLSCAQELWPVLQGALRSDTWQMRESYLVKAYESIAVRHNALKLTEPLPEQATPFYRRSFQVIALHGFADALLKRIEDPVVKRIAERPLIGSIDLLSDNTDFVSTPYWRSLARQLY
jgi:Domain of unknown function (DUF4037)